ncbi:bifunctional metallophosphatase/5'-nucleotidase [Hymenobacter lapidiphilus]|uniref:bifunctional metallophosphatase/5'-nucleotidase n=1 Tax=Hymenobacter sp. CCM 8763 TaxID=2303334 RepID=UPI00167E6F5D|nr:bifunctional UDP-sugar hydrolase/5'-nucleotidase [Hymenobacter sp. CCM 8763]
MKTALCFLSILLAPVLGFAQRPQPATSPGLKKITLLYTNDLHAHLEPQKLPAVSETRLVGGFANIATLVKQEKQANPNTLYVDAGDFFTGPYISTLTEGAAVVDVMNYLQLDAACIGNHEFDHGWQNVPKQFDKATFPILNGNIFRKGTDQLLWNHPYKIIVKNGVRIGLIGLHGRFAFYDTISDEMIQGVEARSEETYLRRYVQELQGQTDLIVLLIHQGIPGRQSTTGTADVSRNLQKDLELARHVPGVDVIVTGHAHQGTREPLEANGTLIVSTNALGTELGRLELVYNPKTDRITSYTNALQVVYDDVIVDDPSTVEAITRWKAKVATIASEPITTLTLPLTRSYGEESTLGNLVADAMLEAAPEYDFAVVNSGGLRQDIAAGPVTLGNLISAFPFLNTLVKLELKGAAVKSIFEHAATLTNGVLQVSKGVVFHYDESRSVGSRVTRLTIKGVPLDDNKTYQVLAPNFLADGGDGYAGFKQALTKKNTGEVLVQPLKRFLQRFPSYAPALEGRIVRQ